MNTEKYIQACLDGALSDIENAPQGMANDTLNQKAFRLYQAVGAGQLVESDVTECLEQAAQAREIPSSEAKATLKSAQRGILNPKPFSNNKAQRQTNSSYQRSSRACEPEDIQKQQKSIEWYERIKRNQPSENQPYLVKKKLTQFRHLLFTGDDRNGQFLAYRLENESGRACGFGRIYSDGSKRNTAGCGATGTYYSPFIGTSNRTEICYVTEGAADACSILAATGCDAFASISSVTMLRVAESLKGKYKEVVCCLDNDNAGRDVGAKLINAGFKCVIPKTEGEDFSDVFVTGGAKELKEQLNNHFYPPKSKNREPTALSLKQFAITDYEEMQKMLDNDNWVLERIALQGQITIIFAKPNSGKTLLTLKMLIDSVKSGRISGEEV